MDIQTIWRFLAWLAGCSIPTGIVLLVVRRLTKGISDRITNAVDAYAGERARLLAQFQNLDRLVEQTEKLTATTETIKARISDEVWDRQMRWTYLRDTYEKLMDALARMRISEYKVQKHLEIYHRLPSLDVLPERRLAEVDELANAIADFVKARDTAFLVLSTEVHNMLQSVVSDLRPTHTETWERDCSFNVALIEKAIQLVRQAGRRDLGYAD